MKSMTGFAAIEVEENGIRLSLRLRAVNGRFLEFKPHMPSDYFPLESEIKKKCSAKLKRGTVDLYISRRYSGKLSSIEVVTNKVLAKKWLKSYQALGSELKLTSDLSLDQLSKVSGVISFEENYKISKAEKDLLLHTLDELLDKCEKEKAREGRATCKDLKSLVKKLSSRLDFITKEQKAVNKGLKSRYLEKLAKLGLENKLEPARLAQEIIVQVDKLDITEEILRLKEHFRVIKELLDTEGSPLGKRLDFFSQELLREINTIGSKCQHSKITTEVVESKGLIESFREIVQNVE